MTDKIEEVPQDYLAILAAALQVAGLVNQGPWDEVICIYDQMVSDLTKNAEVDEEASELLANLKNESWQRELFVKFKTLKEELQDILVLMIASDQEAN